MDDRDRPRIDAAAAAAAAILFALTPLSSADLWWHLASGREIWRLRAIPRTDPFSFASDPGRWLDHGWLFQTIVWPLHELGGALLLQALQVALVFGIAFFALRQLRRDAVPQAAALVVIALAMAAAKPRLTLRPELVTLLLLAILLGWLRRSAAGARWPAAAAAAMALLWANLHPGVVLGTLLVLVWFAAEAAARFRDGTAMRPLLREHAVRLLTFSLPLAITPYGIESVLFPFRLRALVASPGFVNPEWEPPTFERLPLLWISAAAVALLFLARAAGRIDIGDDASRWARPAVAIVLAVFAFQYQRNVGAWGAALPFLAGPEVAAAARALSANARRALIATAGALAVYSLVTFQPPGLGINKEEIPVDAVEFAREAGIRGRMFNQARFGGYLIWRLYPREKVLIDGRNEVYTRLLPRIAEAVGDGRAWTRFLADERIEWAIIGYNNPPQQVTVMTPAGPRPGGARPFGYLHFPPRQWALVYWDDVAMVLVRRAGANHHVEARAPRTLWPESLPFAAEQIESGAWPRAAVAADLRDAIQRTPDTRRAQELADLVRPSRAE